MHLEAAFARVTRRATLMGVDPLILSGINIGQNLMREELGMPLPADEVESWEDYKQICEEA